MKKRLRLTIGLLLFGSLLLSGCGLESAPTRWETLAESVSQTYAPATCIRHSGGRTSTFVTMQDEELGFTYTVMSTNPQNGLISSSDYASNYLLCMEDKYQEDFQRLAKTYSMDIQWHYPVDENGLLATCTLKVGIFETYISELYTLINRFDTRNVFHNMSIDLYGPAGFLGTYFFACNEYIPVDDYDVNWMRNLAYVLLTDQGKNFSSQDNLCFVNKHLATEDELHKITEFTAVYREFDTPYALSNIEVYRFSYEDRLFEIANLLIAPDNLPLIYEVEP